MLLQPYYILTHTEIHTSLFRYCTAYTRPLLLLPLIMVIFHLHYCHGHFLCTDPLHHWHDLLVLILCITGMILLF